MLVAGGDDAPVRKIADTVRFRSVGGAPVTDLAVRVPPPAVHAAHLVDGTGVVLAYRDVDDPLGKSCDPGRQPTLLHGPVTDLAVPVVSPAVQASRPRDEAAVLTADVDVFDRTRVPHEFPISERPG